MNLIEVADLAKDYVLGDTVVHALAGVTLAIGVVSFDLWNPGWWGAVSLLAMLCAVHARTVTNGKV